MKGLKIWYIGFFLALLLPALAYFIVPYPIGTLFGEVKQPELGELSWWNKSKQTNIEHSLTLKHPLFPLFLMARNEIEFDLTHKVNAQEIYCHKGVMFRMRTPDFIENHDYVGQKKADSLANALARYAKAKGKPVYVIIPPNKRRIFGAYLPEKQREKDQLPTNYRTYQRAFKKHNIPFIDAQEWLSKGKQRHPIMSKYGVHWTSYGAYLTIDSLMRRINTEQKTNYLRLPMQIQKKGVYHPNDIDLINLSNLFFKRGDETLQGIKVVPSKGDKRKKWRPLVIGDSFYYALYWTHISQALFHEGTCFYYYFNTRCTQQFGESTRKREVVEKDLNAADALLFIVDIQNLSRFGFGFIEEMGRNKKSR